MTTITVQTDGIDKAIATITQTGPRGGTNVTRWNISTTNPNAIHYLRGYGGDASKVTRDEKIAIRAALLA